MNSQQHSENIQLNVSNHANNTTNGNNIQHTGSTANSALVITREAKTNLLLQCCRCTKLLVSSGTIYECSHQHLCCYQCSLLVEKCPINNCKQTRFTANIN